LISSICGFIAFFLTQMEPESYHCGEKPTTFQKRSGYSITGHTERRKQWID
jgi:hypothetical protein